MPLKSIISRLAAVAGIAYSYIWVFWLQDATLIGSSTVIKDGSTSITSATSPQAVLMGFVGVAIYCVVLNIPAPQQEFRIAPMWRRAAAFAVDSWFSMFTLGSLLGFLDVSLEAVRTGIFRWHYHRSYFVATDSVRVALVFVGMATLVAYFLLPLMRRGQTVGCWIFRLATVNLDGHVVYLPFSIAMRRLFAEFRGLCSPFRTFRKRDEQGRTFYDLESGFTAVCY